MNKALDEAGTRVAALASEGRMPLLKKTRRLLLNLRAVRSCVLKGSLSAGLGLQLSQLGLRSFFMSGPGKRWVPASNSWKKIAWPPRLRVPNQLPEG